ncbi:cytochrome C [Sulfuricaulis limicola]|uniref:Cytochrome C n=1 Tax=Sulfuricaulis limicola TaxID=1620215 RepID=A0A1B4XJN9_9GAMM|nr:OmcA/MtrC family decaheme c-type cytochrome [Sulfuricaulis limicola]BAV35011.1 cytochrome C [Sulfuricaulis limicola]
MSITGVTISSPPVVTFSIANQDGVPVAGLTKADLRFNIAKLVPGTNGAPSNWQNYINVARSGAVAGSQERNMAGAVLVDHLNGTYTYTFGTDITSAAANPCPAPCTDASGNPLDISYQPSLTHRVTIQQGNSAYPKYNATYDFVPGSGPVANARDIVTTAKCNECHNQLSLHGSRVETRLCVTCHNPGTWSAGTPNKTVDFKVMIHKIHRGHDLPSVVAGGTYAIGSHDYSDVHFPQDIRNCTKCHDGAASAQGNNWQTQPSIAACGSCHDNIDFSKARSADPNGHSGGDVSAVTDSESCLGCHSSGEEAGSIAEKHALPALLKAEGAKYKLKIVSVTNTAPLALPTIRFSITNAADVPYDIAATPAITGGSMSLLIGWSTTDINNNGRSNSQPISISLLSSGALAGTVTNNGDGTYSVTSTTAVPADATGSGRAGFHARFSADVNGDATKETIQVKSVVKDFLITGASLVARRTVVDMAKCNLCHERLSLHGGARTDEPQICVMCHNPNATDVGRRPKTGGIPVAATMLDLKKEESIDFKRMIHGIHAADMRTKGLVVYGFFSAPATQNPVDFSHVRFPGILKDCASCHTTSSYQLSGVWASPTQSGILGSTIDTAPSAVDAATLTTGLADQTDDLNISPTAAVCSSCHDDTLAQTHMTWGTGTFSATEATINTNLETCSICHGPGSVADIKTVHGVK